MNTFLTFARGVANRGRPLKVFDWTKAAEILKERGVEEASAGLEEDWDATGGDILQNGKPIPEDDTYCYLSSNWATPVLRIDNEFIDCWRMESETPGWNSGTFWPPEALAIFNGKGQTFDGQAEELLSSKELPLKE